MYLLLLQFLTLIWTVDSQWPVYHRHRFIEVPSFSSDPRFDYHSSPSQFHPSYNFPPNVDRRQFNGRQFHSQMNQMPPRLIPPNVPIHSLPRPPPPIIPMNHQPSQQSHHEDEHERQEEIDDPGPAVIVDMKQIVGKIVHKVKRLKAAKEEMKKKEEEEENLEMKNFERKNSENFVRENVQNAEISEEDSPGSSETSRGRGDKLEKRLLLAPSISKVMLSLVAPKMLKLQFDLMLQAMFAEVVKKLVLPVVGAVARGKVSPNGSKFIPNYYPLSQEEEEEDDEEYDEDGDYLRGGDEYDGRRSREGGRKGRGKGRKKGRRKNHQNYPVPQMNNNNNLPSSFPPSSVITSPSISSSSFPPSSILSPSIIPSPAGGILVPSSGGQVLSGSQVMTIGQQQYILTSNGLIPLSSVQSLPGSFGSIGSSLGIPMAGLLPVTKSQTPIVLSSGQPFVSSVQPIVPSGQVSLVMSTSNTDVQSVPTSNNVQMSNTNASSVIQSATNPIGTQTVPEMNENNDERYENSDERNENNVRNEESKDEEGDNYSDPESEEDESGEERSDQISSNLKSDRLKSDRLKSDQLKSHRLQSTSDDDRMARWNLVLREMNQTVV